MNPRLIAVLSVALLVLSITMVNCASVQRQTPTMAEREIPITTGELRVHVYDYQNFFASVVESTATEIVREEQELLIREYALRWETNAISAMQGATFRVDPLAAMGDAWGLTLQMYFFFRDGRGKELFGERQELVVSASRRLEDEVFRLVESFVGTERATEVRSRLTAWALENPFTDLTFASRSATKAESAITAAQLGGGAMDSVVQIEESVRDLSQRLSIYMELIPKQIRWNSELLVAEMRRDFLNDMLADIASIDDSFVRVADFADGTPELIAGQRVFVLEKMEQELTRVLENIDHQRVETIGVLQSEIGTAEDSLSKELDKTLQALKGERVALMADLETYTERTLEQTMVDSQILLDHLFWRSMQLVLLVAGIVVVVMLLARFIFRGRNSQA